MRAHQGSWPLLVLVLGIAVPTTALGQAVEIGPLVGVYAPVGTFRSPDAFSFTLPTTPSDLGAVAWGGQGRLWVTPRFGVQLQAAVAASRRAAPFNAPSSGSGGVDTIHAQIVILTAQVLYRPAPRALPLVLSAGIGIVRHGGDAYAGFSTPSPVAGVVGFGFDVHVGHALTATLGLTTLFYSIDLQDSGGRSLERGFQADLLPHLSLAWRSPTRN